MSSEENNAEILVLLSTIGTIGDSEDSGNVGVGNRAV